MATAEIRGTTIVYESTGRGEPPLVWGHGLTSSRANEDAYPFVRLDEVARDRQVVRYDARGHGASGDFGDPAQGSWSELAVDQVALIDHLDLDQLAVGGASMGAATALHAALLLRDRLRALVLAIPPTGWETRRAQAGMYLERADIVETQGVEPLIARMWEAPTPDPYDPDAHRARTAARMRASDPAQLAAAYRAAATADLPDPAAIATIATPTLIVAWTGDPGHPVSTANRLAELLPHVHLSVASTAPAMEAWTDEVRSFLAAH
jgi:3-oxoadipate enol-lactonase